MTNVMQPFEPLSRLFKGDASRVFRVLEIFERTTRQDLDQLDAAYASRDWTMIGQLAHKMKSACLQIGEASAATGLDLLERMHIGGGAGNAIIEEFMKTRSELEGVMGRVALYLTTKDESGDE